MARKTANSARLSRRPEEDDDEWEEEDTPTTDDGYDSHSRTGSVTTSQRASRQRLKATSRRKRQSFIQPLTVVPTGKRKTRLRKDAAQAHGQRECTSVRRGLEGTLFGEVIGHCGEILWYYAGILKITLGLLARPFLWVLTWVFMLYLLAVVLFLVYRAARHSVLTTLQPVCRLPGAGLVNLPFCLDAKEGKGEDQGEEIPRLMDTQSGFEEVLQDSMMGATMMWDLKNSEIAVRDLSGLVKISELVCKDQLSTALDSFVLNAKTASRSLSRFNSRVNGVVDNIVALNEYAIGTLLDAQQQARLNPPTSIGGQFWGLVAFPFKISVDIKQVENEVLEMYFQASGGMGSGIKRLIMEAEAVRMELDVLEEGIAGIHEMVKREANVVEKKHDQILAELWTMLGGNRRKISEFEKHLALLKDISVYRSSALRHINASILRLQQMSHDLDELRDSVARPALYASAGKESVVPVQVHIESIRKGVERLNMGKKRALESQMEYMKRWLGTVDNAAAVRVDAI